MFATPRIDQPISGETGVHSDEDIRALNDTNARDPESGTIGHSPMNPDDGHTHVLNEPGLDAVGDVQQARIDNDRLYSDSERQKAGQYKLCLEKACAMRDTGQYHFDRFRNMHLLNLCLYTSDIKILQDETYSMITGNGSSEPGGSCEALGQEPLKEKISSMRRMLKSYSELSL